MSNSFIATIRNLCSNVSNSGDSRRAKKEALQLSQQQIAEREQALLDKLRSPMTEEQSKASLRRRMRVVNALAQKNPDLEELLDIDEIRRIERELDS